MHLSREKVEIPNDEIYDVHRCNVKVILVKEQSVNELKYGQVGNKRKNFYYNKNNYGSAP
jgi:hypothetical protein